MDVERKGYPGLSPRKLIAVTIGFCLLYWILDGVMDAFLFQERNLVDQIFQPTLHQLRIRLLTCFILASFSAYLLAASSRVGRIETPADQKEEKFRQLAENIREVFWMTDPAKNQMIYISPGYEEIWGRSCDSLYGAPRQWIEAIHPEDRDRVLQAALSKQILGEYDEEYRIHRPDGSIRWIHDRAFPVRNAFGEVFRITGVAEDITARKEMELAVYEGETNFKELINISIDAIIMVDEEQRITLFNKGAERTFGYEASEVIGGSLDLLLPLRFVESHHEHLRNFAAGTETAQLMGQRRREILGRRKDGTEFSVEASIAKLDREGKTSFISILHDITHRQANEETILSLAHYDSLTDLPNRLLFCDLLRRAMLAAEKGGKSLALLLIDLDRFKEVNDTLGHPRGDLLLQQVGQRLQEAVRPTDAVSRLGGDEFALLLPLAEAEHAMRVAGKIMEALEPSFKIEDLPIHVEASIGIALYPEHGVDVERLMQRADIAMYKAKEEGTSYMIYRPEHDRYSSGRLALMGDLSRAINEGELLLHYQPKIDLKRGHITGVEALVRWHHPKLGIVPPVQFIMPAERTGLIKPMTRWIINEALRQCQAWHHEGLKISMAINLSARNLSESRLAAEISELLQRHGLHPSFLELEVTESAIMADPVRARELLTEINAMGVRLSIDDFGTGYSSLSYLKKLPVDMIKIDRTFVMDMAVNEEDALIVRSTIDLGHNLGLMVTAEGVENRETMDQLLALGCDSAQGYYLCRPLPAADLVRWCKASHWVID